MIRARFANGLGNRFVLVDLRQETTALPPSHWIKQAESHGYPVDQIVEIHPDLEVRFFNRDGSQAESCGNGLRCAALWLSEDGHDHIDLKTLGGDVHAMVQSKDEISVVLPPPQITRLPDMIRLGNPHLVVWRESLEDLQLQSEGEILEYAIPERQNVSFACLSGPNKIELKVWERGAGATEACGTAACATHISARLQNLVSEQSVIQQRGGLLKITWPALEHPVILTGPAVLDDYIL